MRVDEISLRRRPRRCRACSLSPAPTHSPTASSASASAVRPNQRSSRPQAAPVAAAFASCPVTPSATRAQRRVGGSWLRRRPRRLRARGLSPAPTHSPFARSAPALAARRTSAPLARHRHTRDINPRALRRSTLRRIPKARRPSAPTSPSPPAPSWRLGAARPFASSAPVRAARRTSALLARPRHHCDSTLRTLRCPSPRRRPRARRPSAPTPPLPPAPSWRVDAARSFASPASAPAARRVSAPLAFLRHHRDITLRALRCPSPPAAQERLDLLRRRRRCRPRCRSASTLLAVPRARRRTVPRAE